MPKANKVGKSRKAAAAAKTSTGSLLGAAVSAADAKNKHKQQPQPSKDEGTDDQTTKINNSQGKQQEETALSRGQRKRLAKREQYLKKEKMIMSTLKLHKQEEQKKRIDGLDALKEALMDTMKGDNNKSTEKKEEEEKPTVAIKSNKAKQKVVASELNRIGLVLQHPAFQSNPFEAMQEHLRNTLAKQGEQQEVESKKRILEETKQAEKRKQEKKERRKGKRHRSKFKATRSRTK